MNKKLVEYMWSGYVDALIQAKMREMAEAALIAEGKLLPEK